MVNATRGGRLEMDVDAWALSGSEDSMRAVVLVVRWCHTAGVSHSVVG